VLAPDALDGHVRNREIELSFQTRCAKGGQRLAQGQDLLLDLGRGFVWAMPMSAAMFPESARPVLPITTQPFPHRGHGRGEGSGRRFDPVPTGVLH